jgi:hypothetical protein
MGIVRRVIPWVLLLAVGPAPRAPAHARMAQVASLDDLTASAAQIFRGRCVRLETGTVRAGNASLPSTTYVFDV